MNKVQKMKYFIKITLAVLSVMELKNTIYQLIVYVTNILITTFGLFLFLIAHDKTSPFRIVINHFSRNNNVQNNY